MAGLPLFKIGIVLFKEMAKPIAYQIKQYAVEHPGAKRLTMRLGRGYEGFSQRIEIMFRGHRVKELKPITDTHALTVGADLVSQSFLISVAVFLVVFEYYRSNLAKVAETAQKATERARRQAVRRRQSCSWQVTNSVAIPRQVYGVQEKEARLRRVEQELEEAREHIRYLESQLQMSESSWLKRVSSTIATATHAGSDGKPAALPPLELHHHTPPPMPIIAEPPREAAPASRHLVKRTKPNPAILSRGESAMLASEPGGLTTFVARLHERDETTMVASTPAESSSPAPRREASSDSSTVSSQPAASGGSWFSWIWGGPSTAKAATPDTRPPSADSASTGTPAPVAPTAGAQSPAASPPSPELH